MTDIEKLSIALKSDFFDIEKNNNFGWGNQSLNILDCVISLNRRYKSFVEPRIYEFSRNHTEIIELSSLISLINQYQSCYDFVKQELNYNDPARSETLFGVINYFFQIQDKYNGDTEFNRLQQWADSVVPENYLSVNVKGFGLAGYQYMRMLFGAQTTKPDVHIRNYVSEAIGKKVNDTTALDLLEKAALLAGLPIREVDGAIWELRARK